MKALPSAALSLAAALLSVAIQGFQYGVNNNIFHVPIVLNWQADLVFADDHFIQSLRFFVSGVWPIVRLLANEANVAILFFVLHVLSRWAALAAIAWAAAELGVRATWARVFVLLWLGLVLSVMPPPQLGAPELFIDYFTHTPITIPLFLASIILATRSRLFAAIALIGVTASINAFVAVWTGWVVAVIGWTGATDRRALLRPAVAGFAVAVLVFSPVASWIYTTVVEQPAISPADYLEFLRAYFPDHFFIDSTEPVNVAKFVGVMLAGIAAFRMLGAAASAWMRGYLGLCFLVLVGAALPYVSHARLLLELQLLRASGMVQLLATVAVVVAAASDMLDHDRRRLAAAVALCLAVLLQTVGQPQAILLLAASRLDSRRWDAALAMAALAVAATAYPSLPLMAAQIAVVAGFLACRPSLERWSIRLDGAVAAVALVGVAVGATSSMINRAYWQRRYDSAREAGLWARQSTPVGSEFLLAPVDRQWLTVPFQVLSRRRIWVDWKRGAAALWQPSYYHEWKQRMDELDRLPDLAARLEYACEHRIDYVLDRATLKSDIAPIFRNVDYQILPAGQSCH